MEREITLLHRVCDAYRAILGNKLTGFYVHGSIAFGCFTWETGDIDFLCVADAPLTQAEKEALIRTLLELTPDAPPKGLEMSVVLAEHCARFTHPTPFELHFSNAHKARAEADLTAYCREMNGIDPDLAAHFTVLHHVGFPLYGPPVAQVFAPVPRACYVDSILADVACAEADIHQNPVYFTLNLCRVLAFLTDGAILSKAQGGQWGLRHLPQAFHPLLQDALAAYRSGGSLDAPAQLAAFSAMMHQLIAQRKE
ncbi:MAG: DUF4111 domain-containing protein [Clostridia bacterium]|nr:DUF4111 domain-containing protein [Clostridia bacterium]